MPLPNNYQPAEHLQDTARKAFNREIKEWFSDVNQEELGLATPRESLRSACVHQEADSLLLTVGRMLMFEFLLRRPWRAAGGEGYGRPPHSVPRRSRPRIVLVFEEDDNDVDPGYGPVIGEVGFRLMAETGESLTEANLVAYGQKIKTLFGSGGGFTWRKGREMLTYTDWDKGYQLQILCFAEADGKRLVEQILDIQSHTPDWKHAELKRNLEESQAYPIVPPTERVLGRNRKLARRRPRADVKFRWAYIELAGLPNKIYLYDHSGIHDEALVKR